MLLLRTPLFHWICMLLVVVGATSHRAASLCYNITITFHFSLGQQQCKIQGQLNENLFLYYDCTNNNVKSFGSLGKKINTTKVWEEQIETLKDVKDVLTQQLVDFKSEISIIKGTASVSLQCSMVCQRKTNGHIHGSWKFGLDGQTLLHFNSEKKHWKVIHPRGKLMKDKWEKDKDVMTFFKMISMGDCKRWLENFLVPWETQSKPTEPPVTTPGTRSWTFLLSFVIILVFVFIVIGVIVANSFVI